MTETVQYRDFLFPHNPASITVSRAGDTVTHFCPGYGEALQQIGGRGRTVTLRGCFLGDSFETANGYLSAFVAAAGGTGTAGGTSTAGTLFLPGCEPFLAALSELTTENSGDGRVIPYVMTFKEAINN